MLTKLHKGNSQTSPPARGLCIFYPPLRRLDASRSYNRQATPTAPTTAPTAKTLYCAERLNSTYGCAWDGFTLSG